MVLWFIHIVVWPGLYCFLKLNYIASCGEPKICLLIHALLDIRVVSTFWLLQKCCCKCACTRAWAFVSLACARRSGIEGFCQLALHFSSCPCSCCIQKAKWCSCSKTLMAEWWPILLFELCLSGPRFTSRGSWLNSWRSQGSMHLVIHQTFSWDHLEKSVDG